MEIYFILHKSKKEFVNVFGFGIMIVRGSPKETSFVSFCHGAASSPVFRIDACSVSLSHPRLSHPPARILLPTISKNKREDFIVVGRR